MHPHAPPLQVQRRRGFGFGSAVFVNEVNNQRRDDNQQYDSKDAAEDLCKARPVRLRCWSPRLLCDVPRHLSHHGRGGGDVVDQWRRAHWALVAPATQELVEAFLVQIVAAVGPGDARVSTPVQVFEAYGALTLEGCREAHLQVRRAVDAVGEAGAAAVAVPVTASWPEPTAQSADTAAVAVEYARCCSLPEEIALRTEVLGKSYAAGFIGAGRGGW